MHSHKRAQLKRRAEAQPLINQNKGEEGHEKEEEEIDLVLILDIT